MGNTLKILVFSPFYPPHIGGLESHADEFNRHIARPGVDITVFTPHLPADAPETEIIQGNIRVIRFPAWEPIHNYPLPKYVPFFLTPKFFRILLSLREERPDIIISRTRFFATSLLALAYAKIRGIPLVHIEHGSDYASFNGSIKTFLGKCYDHVFGWMVLRFADRVIANSQASASFVKKLSGQDAMVIYRGTKTQIIEQCDPDQKTAEAYRGKTVIAFIGRLIDGKGTRDLITALARLKRTDIVTFIIGGGPEEMHLKKMTTEHCLENQVIFFGNLPFEKALGVLKTADIVVNPSYTEGLPTSVTEAALCRKAIIATDVGGTREVISGSSDGFLIPPRRPELIAEKIGYLLDHPDEREQLGRNAYARVSEKFSWDESAKQYLVVFQELRENKKG
jgi:glycosyltransferase involved in cell wall biosynthesis